jgi:hypothetical protein
MDYKKIYDNFMQDRLNKKPERLTLKKKGEYFEGHHHGVYVVNKICFDESTISIVSEK